MLAAAHQKVVEPTTETVSRVRKVGEPRKIPLREFLDRAVHVRPTDPIYATRFQTAVDFTKMLIYVRKVLDSMMRIKCVNRAVWEWKEVAQIRPEVASRREHVGIHIDPAAQVVMLSRPELNSNKCATWSAEMTIQPGICAHERSSEYVEKRLCASA